EFEEEIGNLAHLLPAWKADPNNIELLQPVRRVFHTLKGSGRLVGARTLGEFSWKIENMLNKVRDGLRPATPPVVAMVDQACAALPQLHAALRGDGVVTIDLRALEAYADRIAGGEEVMPVLAAAAPATAPVEAIEVAAPVAEASAPVAAVEPPAVEAPHAVESGDEVSVDPVLFEILQAEVSGHLVTIDGWLARAHAAPTAADDPLLRAIHTMNGAFAMTEVPSITDALTPAEGYVRRLLALAGEVDADGVSAIAELADRIRDTVVAIAVPGGRVPSCDALAARLVALRDSLPEAGPVQVVDHPPAMPEAPVELTELDLSAYGRFDAEPAAEAPVAPAATPEQGAFDPDQLAREAEAELTRLFAQAETPVAPQAPAAPEPAAAAPTGPEDAARLLALMESYEAERAEAERAEAARLAELRRAEHEDFMRFEAERLEAERLEAERLEAERLEAERLEAERLEAERLDAERLDAERLEAERLDAERLEAERLEAERREAELLEAERLLAEGSEPASEVHVEPPAFADFVLPEEPVAAEAAPAEAASAEPAPAADNARPADSVIAVLLAHSAVTDPDEPLDMRDLDEDLMDIFVEEGRDLLDHSDQLLVGLRASPEDREIIAGLQRDLHTLKGGARMAGVMPIGELGHAMESLLEAAAEHRLRLGNDDIPLLETGFDRLHTMVTRVGDRRAVAVPDALVAAFDTRALGHALELPAHLASAPEPEVEAPAFADVEAQAEIAEPVEAAHPAEDEAFEIEDIALDAVSLETTFAEAAPVEEGATASAADEPVVIESVAIEPEPVAFEPVPVETALVEVEDFEYAFAEIEAAEAAQAEPAHVEATPVAAGTPESTIETETEAETAEADAEATLEAQPEAATAAAEAPTFAPLPGLRPLSAPMTFGDRDDEDASLRGNQDQVRVRAELLDRLVNYAGEVAIYRSRLEQQLGAFRGATSEMEQTTARLRDQLRRLEIETEAQIIARYQREGDTPDATFDPLELDRFSTLQQLSRALSETATDLGSLHTTLDDLTQQYETLLLQQSRVSSELQEGLMRTRMVPFDTVVPRLRRVLRQAAADTGRQVQLKVDGAQGELDRNVLERMTAPLEHMLRNSVAHGLESPAQRTAAGKAAEGVVVIAVRKEGSEVVLQITDDGRGLDRKAIRERGEARGLVRPGVTLSNAQLDALIFEPGFSTAEEVTRLAGRGVGMDVVSSEVRQLGGTIDIQSEPGKGTTFVLRLPQTLAVTQAAFVRIGETTFAVPIASVRGVGRIPREELANGATTYRYGSEEYALHDLGKLIGHAPAKAEGQLQMPLLLTRSGDLHVAVTVDQIVGNREIVVKPIGPQVASIPGIFGATIMGDGSVVVILDVAPLVRRLAAQPEEIEEAPALEQRAVPLVMVVDDSITMRKVTGRVLERHNFEVLTAKDGLDALERMVDVVPDLMLLDIEMPRMDGYELATAMKADPRLARVPIIMITSRTGDKHRQRAMDIGVDRYLGKPYQENELMRNVFSLLEPVRSDA
ncbi:MAG: response regulator, partial [Lysobacteraceae bacterium]